MVDCCGIGLVSSLWNSMFLQWQVLENDFSEDVSSILDMLLAEAGTGMEQLQQQAPKLYYGTQKSFYSLSIAFLAVHGMWNWKHSWSILRTRPHQKPQAPLSFVWGHWKTHSNQSKCKCIAILSDLMCPLVRCLGWWQFMTTGPWLF